MFHKNSSLKVIYFMLQTDCKQTVGSNGLLFTVRIKIANDDAFRTFDLVEDTGHRETSFLTNLKPFTFDKFRIDEHQQLIPGFRGIDDDNPHMYVHLRRGQTDSRRLVHRFGHITSETSNAIVNIFNLGGDGFQARVRVTEYWQ